MRPPHVMDALATIADQVDAVEVLFNDAYEVAFSQRRTGTEKVSGGNPSDATGERASCLCEDRDEEHGGIVHSCSPQRIKIATKEILTARSSLKRAVNHLEHIITGSDHHEVGVFEARDRQRVRAGDHNPATARAGLAKAKRIANDMAGSYRRRLLAAGLTPMQADTLAERMRKVA